MFDRFNPDYSDLDELLDAASRCWTHAFHDMERNPTEENIATYELTLEAMAAVRSAMAARQEEADRLWAIELKRILSFPL